MRKIIICITITFVVLVNTLVAQSNQNILEAAENKMRANDIEGALILTNDVIEKNPKYANGYSFRANLYEIKGDFSNAIADLSKAIELYPKESELYLRRASSKQMLRDFKGSLIDYDKALEMGAEGDRVFASRANIKQILGDQEGAFKDYEMAVNIRPHSVIANMGYARILFRIRDKKSGIEHLNNFLKKTETDWNNEFPKLNVKKIGDEGVKDPQDKDWNESKAVQIGKTILPKNEPKTRKEADDQNRYMEQILNLPAAYATLASFYLEVEDINNAEQNLNKAFQLDSRGNSFYDIRSRIRFKKQDYLGAIDDVTKAMARFTYPTLFLERGLAYFMLGKEKEAQGDFTQFLQMFPDGKIMLDKKLEEAKKLKEN